MPSFRTITDHTGHTLTIAENPKRIVSLVPSQTELLHHLNCTNVVGITKFCIHPNDWFRTKQRVGGTKKVDFGVIKLLNPDLILANQEENSRADILKLREKYPVWTSNIKCLEDNNDMIRQIGLMVGKEIQSEKLISEIDKGFDALDVQANGSALYLIWNDPIMAVGRDTFINDMLCRSGFENILSHHSEVLRYPELTHEQIRELNPDHIFLSSEPFPFKASHLHKYQTAYPKTKIQIVDGEMFSWYGSRIKLAPSYFKSLTD